MTVRPHPHALALAMAALVLGAAPRAHADEAQQRALAQQALEAGRHGSAVVQCELAEHEAQQAQRPLELDTRKVCAQAYLGLGDKLSTIGSAAEARECWQKAAQLDPTLLDDAAFVQRMQTGVSPTPPPPRLPDTPPPADKPPEHRPPDPPTPPEPPAAPGAMTDPSLHRAADPVVPPPDPGPRAGRKLGVGLGLGFDGVTALTLGWLRDEHVSFEVSVGLVFRTLDTRVRFLGFRRAITPVLGVGMMTPFGRDERLGPELGSFRALYELGQHLHVDLGLSWAASNHFDVFAGVAFLTSVNQDHPDRVIMFPQAAVQALYYF